MLVILGYVVDSFGGGARILFDHPRERAQGRKI
jgi:hypothetical protein